MTSMMVLPLLAFKTTFDQGHSVVWTVTSTQLFLERMKQKKIVWITL